MEIENRQARTEQAKAVLEGARSVLILTGAGISAESGVPTFRGGGGTAVWRGIPFEQLSSAEMVETNLPLVWEWFDYRRGVVNGCEPNAGHMAIAEAQQSGRFEEFTLVTQNIDGLHRSAGSQDVIELHGDIHKARCLTCGSLQALDVVGDDERPPVCSECFDSMRPHVVLFGEALDEDALLIAYDRAAACDVCMVVGTSAEVYPAMHIPMITKPNGAFCVEVNLEQTCFTPRSDLSLFGRATEILPTIIHTIS